MNIELRPCPVCGSDGESLCHVPSRASCSNNKCRLFVPTVPVSEWNTRPIEDELRRRISELEEENLILEKWLREKKSRISELEADVDRLSTGHRARTFGDGGKPNPENYTSVYVSHSESCPARISSSYPHRGCTCGLSKIMEGGE